MCIRDLYGPQSLKLFTTCPFKENLLTLHYTNETFLTLNVLRTNFEDVETNARSFLNTGAYSF